MDGEPKEDAMERKGNHAHRGPVHLRSLTIDARIIHGKGKSFKIRFSGKKSNK